MEKKCLFSLDQDIYYEELKNGLKIVLIPNENRKDYYVSYTTKYGSVNLNFIPEGDKKVYNSPKGIAHFLEHKMFEQPSGEDPFTFFSKTGTGSNAGTSYKKTSYFIYGINNLEENLDYLINFVNEPYFTDQNVEKEKGIIIEEIKMYDDDPDWILAEEVAKATFYNHPIRYDIAGYVDTVSKITKEDLYKCYNTFYSPNNMILVVSGNFDVDRVMNVIKDNKLLNSKTEKTVIKEVKDIEKESVNNKYKEITIPNIAINKIGINFKISLKDVKDKHKFSLYMSGLISILFGSTSSFKDEMMSKGYSTGISCSQMLMDDFFLIEFYAEGDKPKELLKEIELRLKEKEITEEEFNRYKKVLIANIVMDSDNPQNIAEEIINDFINFDEIFYDKIDIIRKLDFKDFIKTKNNTDFSNTSCVILKKGND